MAETGKKRTAVLPASGSTFHLNLLWKSAAMAGWTSSELSQNTGWPEISPSLRATFLAQSSPDLKAAKDGVSLPQVGEPGVESAATEVSRKMTIEERIEIVRELNGAVTGTIGYLDLIQDPAQTVDKDECLRRADTSAKRALKITHQLLRDAIAAGHALSKGSVPKKSSLQRMLPRHSKRRAKSMTATSFVMSPETGRSN